MAKLTLKIDTETAVELSNALSALDGYEKIVKDGEKERGVRGPYKFGGGLRMTNGTNIKALADIVDTHGEAQKDIFNALRGDEDYIQDADDQARLAARLNELKPHPVEVEQRTISEDELRLDINPIPGTVLANLICCEEYKVPGDKVEIRASAEDLLQLNRSLVAMNGLLRFVADGQGERGVMDPYKLSAEVRKAVANNLRALKPVVRAVDAAREAARNELRGKDEILTKPEQKRELERRIETALAIEYAVEVHTFKEADLKLDTNEFPGTVLSGLALVVDEMRADDAEKVPVKRETTAAERKAEAALKPTADVKVAEHLATRAPRKSKDKGNGMPPHIPL